MSKSLIITSASARLDLIASARYIYTTMKLTIPTKEFREALARLSNIPGAFGAAPYTTAVRLSAGMDGLTLTRFTNEAKITLMIENVSVEDDIGSVAVGHGSLATLVSRMTAKDITISSDDKKLHLDSGYAKAALSIFGDEVEVAPPEPELETESVKMPIEELARLLSSVAPAMGKDATGNNTTFHGICLRYSETRKTLAFIATDRFRCHVAFSKYAIPADCVIPAPAVEAILKVIAGEKGACTFAVGERTVVILSDNLEMSVTLLEAKFPPSIERLIDPDASSIKSKVRIDKQKLTDALKACAPLADGTAKAITFTADKGLVTLKATSGSESEIAFDLPCEVTAPFVIGLASMQMANALDFADAEEGNIELHRYESAFYISQFDRLAFVALQKPPES